MSDKYGFEQHLSIKIDHAGEFLHVCNFAQTSACPFCHLLRAGPLGGACGLRRRKNAV
jgi:hypothetical protein